MNWNRLIIQSVGSLGVLQITNYLVPVLVIPLLLARVGLESYGMIVLAQGIMNFAVAITDFGLNLTGTRLISQAKGDLSLERTLTQKILMIKIVLLLGTFIGLVFLVKTVSPWQPYEYLILTSYFIVIGNTLMPVWYFQGIQKMTWLALLNFLSRVFYVGTVLFFIESSEDLLWVNVCNGLGWCIAAFFGWVVLFIKTKFRFEKQSFKTIYAFAHQNVPIFLSEGVTTFYRNIGIVIAGFLVMKNTGKEFMPSLNEGSFLLMPTSMPHSGIEENKRVLQQLDMAVASLPEIKMVVGKAGRTESALDPAPLSMYENVINYKSEFILNENLRNFKKSNDQSK